MSPARLLRLARLRVRSVFQSDLADAELRQEVAFHFDQLVHEFRTDGLSPDEATRAARRSLGSVTLIEERARDERRMTWWHDFWQDSLFGVRMLRKNRAFTAIATASLALGIGANAAVLGVMDSLVREGLPFPNADRLVRIRTFPLNNPQASTNASVPDYLAWNARSRAFEVMGVSLPEQADLSAEIAGTAAVRVAGQGFTPAVFQALGVQPALGRVFTDAESQLGNAAPVIVISHRFRERYFGADKDIVNRRVRLNGVPATIIGVMPEAFRYPNENVDYWAPLPIDPLQRQGSARFFMVTARLRPNATLQQAQAEVAGINSQLVAEFPERRGWGVRVVPMHEALLGWTRQPLRTFEVAVALVLLIACANVAGLLLARGSVRRSEMAVRMALGAGRGRIVRQLLTEALLLSLIGGLLGLLVAWWGLRSLALMGPPPGGLRIVEVGLNARMLLVAASLSMLTGLLFGMAPALAASTLNLTGSLNESVRGTGTHSSGHRLRGALVAAQIALALVLLVGTGLMVKSFARLAARELSFDPQRILTFGVRLHAGPDGPAGRVSLGAPDGVAQPPALTLERLYDRLRAVPGAQSVAGISIPPVNSLLVPSLTVHVEGRPRPATEADRAAATATYFVVTPGFFATMRARMVSGREFEAREDAAAPWTAVINETAARRFWPGENPIGKRFTLDVPSGERPREVIGVVRDIPRRSAYVDPDAMIYTSFLQQSVQYRGPFADMFGQMTFLLRSSGDPMALLPAARRAVAEIAPDSALASAMLMDWYVAGGLRDRRTAAIVLGVFAFAATVLAAIGVYGVMSYLVAQRTREIGIRMALGASALEVIALVGGSAVRLIAIGVLLGLAGSIAFARLITSQLWEVTPTDPATYAGVSLLLALVALLAIVVPLRRAVAVDPTVALRYE